MTEEIPMDDYFNSLNANKVLIGVLNQIKQIEIPVSFFTNVPDSQMMVTLNEDGSKFIFSLKEENGN